MEAKHATSAFQTGRFRDTSRPGPRFVRNARANNSVSPKRNPKMKVINVPIDNHNNAPLTLAELEAIKQFEASDKPGQALFRPMAVSGNATPDCLVFLEGVCRFGLMFHAGQYSVRDGQWYHRTIAEDEPTLVDNPLEEAWQRAMVAKDALRDQLNIGAFFIPVVVFADMERDDDILDELRGRKVRVLWGMEDLIGNMLAMPDRDDLHPRLNNRFIEKEIQVLSQQTPKDEPGEEQMTLDLTDSGQLVLQQVDVVNIYITVAGNATGRE